MLIKIDTRETDWMTECVTRSCVGGADVTLKSETLPIGDAIIIDNDGKERAIIERKTLNDLAASIRDGRYAEQSFRLNGCVVPNHNIYYLIEGTLSSYNQHKTRLDRKSLLSALTTISYFKGFSLHRTNSIGESAEWLLSFADKIRRQSGSGYYEEAASGSSATVVSDYVAVSSRVKKDNVTSSNIGAIMLAQIPGVSTAVATAVMDHASTMKGLIEMLENNPKSLDGVVTITKSGKERRISKTARSNIYNFLIPSAEESISVSTD